MQCQGMHGHTWSKGKPGMAAQAAVCDRGGSGNRRRRAAQEFGQPN